MGFKAGDNATMLVIFQLAADSPFYYQCADVSLVETSLYTAPTDQYVCGNYTATLQEAQGQDFGGSEQYAHSGVAGFSPSATPSASAAANTATIASSNSSDGISAAAGGGIGAAVALVVAALLLALAFFTGFVSFGKKRSAVRPDDASSESGYPVMKQSVA